MQSNHLTVVCVMDFDNYLAYKEIYEVKGGGGGSLRKY